VRHHTFSKLQRRSRFLATLGWRLAAFVALAALASSQIDAAAQSAALTPEGGLIATVGGLDGGVKVLDLKTGALRREQPAHMEWVMSVAFSPDGKRLAIGGGNLYHGDVAVVDAAIGERLWVEKDFGRHHQVSLAFSPDGKLLGAACPDGPAKLFDAGTGKLIRALEAPGVTGIAFSPDGKTLAGACLDELRLDDAQSEVRLWDVSSGKLLRTLPGLRGPLAISPDGKLLASAGERNTVYLHDLESGEPVRALSGGDPARRASSLEFAPQGPQLAAHDGTHLRLWDARSGEALATRTEEEAAAIAWSRDGTMLAAIRHNGATWRSAAEGLERVPDK
jgi:WD40 repeat protein